MRLAAFILTSAAFAVGPVWADPLYDAAITNFMENLSLQKLNEEDNRRSATCFVDLLDDDERRAVVQAETTMEVYAAIARLNGGAAADCEIAILVEAGLI